MTETGWEESTESPFLAGKTMPPAGIACTLVAIKREQMQDREKAQGIMQTVFIAEFAEEDVKPWVVNKEGRKFLRYQCGINDQNIGSFAPIPLLLMQTPARGAFPPGIGVMARTVDAPNGDTEVPPQLSQPSDDVPF